MQVGTLLPYEQALSEYRSLGLRSEDGRTVDLDLARWLAPVDAADRTVLDRCSGPTLDVGCGPGRFVSALAERGVPALGVDIASTAVMLNQARGLPALLRNVFSRVPGEGRWPVVLLMDGNIGIGGDPLRLLARLRSVGSAGGQIIVETDPDRARDECLDVRFVSNGAVVGPRFAWARVGRDALTGHARRAGLATADTWTADGRTFMALAR